VFNLEKLFNLDGRKIRYIRDNDGCWICTSHKPKTQRSGTKSYYSIKGFDGRVTMIHQMIYRKFYGDYDGSLCVRHRCDNALCINLEHLELGTHQDNMDDMNTRRKDYISSIRKGNKNANSKLDWDIVKSIRNAYAGGNTTQAALAYKYGVSRQLIQKVVRNEI
jgi:Mor family transcriptional regulator